MAGHPLERPPYDAAPPTDTLGLRHVREALRDLPFPATRAEILHRAGAWRIPTTGNHFHRLSEYLEGVDEKTYTGPDAVLSAVARAHPHLRE